VLPEVDKAQDFIRLVVLAYLAVGIAEQPRVGVLGQEG